MQIPPGAWAAQGVSLVSHLLGIALSLAEGPGGAVISSEASSNPLIPWGSKLEYKSRLKWLAFGCHRQYVGVRIRTAACVCLCVCVCEVVSMQERAYSLGCGMTVSLALGPCEDMIRL